MLQIRFSASLDGNLNFAQLELQFIMSVKSHQRLRYLIVYNLIFYVEVAHFAKCFPINTCVCCRRMIAVFLCLLAPVFQFHFQDESKQLIICS